MGMEVQVVSVPYRYDEHRQGAGAGPTALLDAGLIDAATAAGVTIGLAGEASLAAEDREPGRTAVNIGKLGASTAALVRDARSAGAGCLVLAGDDTAAIGIVSGLQLAHGAGARIGVVWIDAHGDFNTPETSYSGILAGMSLAIVAGLAGPNWRDAANMSAPIPTDRIIVGGARQLDAKEAALLNVTDVRVFTTEELRDPAEWSASVERLARTVDYITVHVDIDVLDPRLVPSSSTPSPDGLELEPAAACIGAVLQTGKTAALTLCGMNPGGGALGRKTIESARRLTLESLSHWTTTP